MVYTKIRGEHNPADVMTKYVDKATLDKHSETLQHRYQNGRANMGLEMQAGRAETGAGKVS